MALRQTKKISELPALSPATLDTTFVVGISGSTTYKISINQLTSSLDTTFATDLVTSALSNSLNSKLSTSSYSTDSASFNSRIISGSAVAGTISGSSQISALGFVTGAYTTINSFNSLTQSFNSISQSFTTVSGSFGSIDFSGINNVTTSYLAFTQSYYSASASFDSRINTVSASVSIGTSGTSGINGTSGTNGTSGAQGNQGPTGPQGNQGPQGESGTSGTTGTSGTNGVQGPQGNQGVQGPQGINGTAGSSGAQGSQGPIGPQGNQGANGSNGTNGSQGNQGPQGNQGAMGSGTQGAQGPTGGTGPQGTQGTQGNQGTQGVQGSIGTSGTSGVSIDSGSFVTTSSYNADSASFDTRINSIMVSSGSNLTYLLEAYANVTYTLPGGFTEDPCRYSVVSATENVPSNWFNTSTYRFTPQKAGYWEINAAYDVYRNTEASMAIKKNGSIVAAAGSFNAVAQDISKTVYLNGSTDYINIINVGGAALQRDQYQSRSWFQAKFVGNISGSTDLLTTNNTFTGTNTFTETTTLKGAVNVGTGSGLEGGEIDMAYAQTTTLTGSAVVFDVYADKIRIFENGGNNRGVSIDLSKAPNGVGGDLMWKASGLVNAGTFVSLDNIKASITTSGNRGLSLAAVSTTFTADISGYYGYTAGGNGASTYNASITTSATTSIFNWGFNTQGDGSTYTVFDKTNNRVYRITIMINSSFNSNFISIERLY